MAVGLSDWMQRQPPYTPEKARRHAIEIGVIAVVALLFVPWQVVPGPVLGGYLGLWWRYRWDRKRRDRLDRLT